MSVLKLLQTNPILSDRVRLSIMGLLAASAEPISFNDLLEALALSKGNLSTHMKKLEDDGLVKVDKSFVDRKPRTTYLCTQVGRQALKEYLTVVQNLLTQTK